MNSNSTQKAKDGKKISLPSRTYSNKTSLVKTDILGVGITNATTTEVLEFIRDSLKKPTANYYIVTPNPEMIVLSRKSSEFKNALDGARIALNDGVGLSFAARFLGKSLHERLTGVDTMKKLCEMSNDWPITVGFLGGGPGVAEDTAECLQREFPKLRVVFIADEWEKSRVIFGEQYLVPPNAVSNMNYELSKENKNNLHTAYSIPHSSEHIDVLFVAFGAPKQELWMAEHLNTIPVRMMMGVGGAFDYISGRVPRAPKLVQHFGLEWLFRLIVQPWRIKRQLALLEFVWMVLKARFSTVWSPSPVRRG